jgi:TRAP-type mannitol/chloroaromatic compound transport system permease small subunit
MLKAAGTIDQVMEGFGELLKWILPVVVALAAAVALLRYGLAIGYPWLSESFVWLNGALVFLGAAAVYAREGHVRVDLVYRWLGPRGRAWANLLGILFFLWPMMAVIAVKAWPALVRSWNLLEASPSIDGLPFLYLMKTAVVAFCVLMAIQGVATLLRSLHIIIHGPGGTD